MNKPAVNKKPAKAKAAVAKPPTFQERWRSLGVTKQLAILLSAVLKENPSRMMVLDAAKLEAVAAEQSIIYWEDEGKVHLRFADGYTTLYTIEPDAPTPTPTGGTPWTTPIMPTASEGSLTSAEPTDEHLADLEARQQRMEQAREEARQLRDRGNPIYSGDRPQKALLHRRPQPKGVQ